MDRLVKVLVIALVLLGSVAPNARATPPIKCPPYEERLAEMDVVAVGKVLAWPLPRILIMSVDRYYKGEGPRILIAEVPGIYHQWQPYHHGVKERRTRWPNAPYMFGFRQGWGLQWVNSDYCDPGGMLVPGSREANAIAMMEEGVAPVPGIAVHSNFAIWFPLVVVLCLILWVRAWVRRRRARRGAR